MAAPIRTVIAILLAAVEIGAGFGDASARTVEMREGSVVVEIEVEVTGTAQAVVAHLVTAAQEEITMPLVNRGGPIFGVVTELAPKDYAVVFEILGGDGSMSTPVTLTDLGADLGSGAGSEAPLGPEGGEGLSPDTQNWGWLALALGAASLSALAFWALGGRERRALGEHDERKEEE